MKKPGKKPAAEPENDLDVLLSTRDITIAGKPITVREITLVDSLVLHDSLTPVVASLAEVMQTEYPRFEHVQQVLAKHATVLPVLIAHCSDQPVEWVQTLPGSEGLALMDWWWAVNRRFFMGAATRILQLQLARAKTLSDSAASSQLSSEQATTQTASATTPPAS